MREAKQMESRRVRTWDMGADKYALLRQRDGFPLEDKPAVAAVSQVVAGSRNYVVLPPGYDLMFMRGRLRRPKGKPYRRGPTKAQKREFARRVRSYGSSR